MATNDRIEAALAIRTSSATADPLPGPSASPEDLVERVVGLTGDGRYVRMAVPGLAPVTLGPYPNPAVARERLADVRRFVAGAIRAWDGRALQLPGPQGQSREVRSDE